MALIVKALTENWKVKTWVEIGSENCLLGECLRVCGPDYNIANHL